MSNYETENTFIPNFEQTNEYTNQQKQLQIPSFVILGPAKTGTRSLIDSMEQFDNMIQYPSERHFWAGTRTYACQPWYSEQQWLWFIENFINQTIKLSYMVSNISNHPNNTRCQIHRYKNIWSTKNALAAIESKNKSCIHPLYKDNINGLEFCYLMEKGPSYMNSPWVAAIFSTLLPKIKVIGILRNPITHVWSNYWAFNRIKNENGKFETNIHKIEMYILDSFMNSNTFNTLRDFCIKMNNKWKKYKNLTNQERYKKMNKNYLKLMGLYLKLRFVAPKDILIKLRLNAFMWFPISIVNVLFWVHAYDNNVMYRNNFKLIQFEYMFKDLSLASNEIKCWLTGGNDCKYVHLVLNETERKNHAWYNDQPTEYFIHWLMDIFKPFQEALEHLLIDRKHFLIGDWV